MEQNIPLPASPFPFSQSATVAASIQLPVSLLIYAREAGNINSNRFRE